MATEWHIKEFTAEYVLHVWTWHEEWLGMKPAGINAAAEGDGPTSEPHFFPFSPSISRGEKQP